MLAREEERTKLGDKPVKYHGKWPFRRVYGIQVLSRISYKRLSGNAAMFVSVSDCSVDMLYMISGTCGCCSVCRQSCYAVSWLGIFFHSCVL